MSETETCDFCERWVATSWDQHRNRIMYIKSTPDATTNPCPRCGGTYWALKPPPGLPSGTGKLHSPLEPMDWTTATKAVAWIAAAILATALYMLLTHSALAQTTFRDSSGRQTGTASTNSNGVTTFRDATGRQTGTATTNGNGTTTFRDGSGRMTGTAERRR
jgi:hypothetical protein